MAAVKWWRTLQKVLDVFSGRIIIMKRKLKKNCMETLQKVCGKYPLSILPSIDFYFSKAAAILKRNSSIGAFLRIFQNDS